MPDLAGVHDEETEELIENYAKTLESAEQTDRLVPNLAHRASRTLWALESTTSVPSRMSS